MVVEFEKNCNAVFPARELLILVFSSLFNMLSAIRVSVSL